MTAREELQCCYAYAFHPPSLNRLWRQIKQQEISAEVAKPLLDKALLLHMALPESGYASQRALQRLALYQAKSRAFGMPGFIRNIRKSLGCEPMGAQTVPAAWVRDIGLPEFTHATRHLTTDTAEDRLTTTVTREGIVGRSRRCSEFAPL